MESQRPPSVKSKVSLFSSTRLPSFHPSGLGLALRNKYWNENWRGKRRNKEAQGQPTGYHELSNLFFPLMVDRVTLR
jgi:hypothetical protein